MHQYCMDIKRFLQNVLKKSVLPINLKLQYVDFVQYSEFKQALVTAIILNVAFGRVYGSYFPCASYGRWHSKDTI